MYILIHNSKGSFSIDLPESFKQINIASIYSSEEENDYLYKNNREEYFLNNVSESLDNSSYSNVKVIIIDNELMDTNELHEYFKLRVSILESTKLYFQ